MATTTLLQQTRYHEHPMELRDFGKDSDYRCSFCYRRISAYGYACKGCYFYIHRECTEVPPRIDAHPLHPDHPLTLILPQPPLNDHVCYLCESFHENFFRCDECDFNLDIRCALSTLSDWGGSQGKTPEHINLPLHHHKLTSFSTRHDFFVDCNCKICNKSVESDMYACLSPYCQTLIHKRCVQDLFGDEYDFNLDINCASSTLLDRRGFKRKTPKWIALPNHHHRLTLVSKRYRFISDRNCVICKERVKGDGYACMHWQCRFIIHRRCIQDLYYADGTKTPQVYHDHPLKTFLVEDKGSSRCEKCESDESREFIGCAECQVFYCRDCVQVPESIQYPHHPKHTLSLLINSTDNDKPHCDSCLVSLEGELCYGCPRCKFFVDVGCALQVLSYCAEGTSDKIKLSWHEHPLHLCHRTEYDSHHCSYCEDKSAGPMYVCKEQRGYFLLHKRCTEIESTIIHPHHPDHPVTVCNKGYYESCGACGETIRYERFSCELCAFYLHAKCSARFPTRKHSLHEHELIHLDKAPSLECNRCGTSTDSPLFRCVPCNFNLHEKCLELPQVVKHDTHFHPLTLQETYVEDDSGEYYCDLCEKRRDGRLGVYVCGQCTARWAFHIECILPELRKVFARKGQSAVVEALDKKIASVDKHIHETDEKLKGLKRELEELMKQRAQIISREEKNYVAMT